MAHIRVEWYRHHGAVSGLNGAARAEKSSTDLVEAATGKTYQDGVGWNGSISVQIWAEVGIG